MPLRTKQPPKSVNCMGVGERGRNRTFNLLIKSQLLCQLSYAPISGWSFSPRNPPIILWVGGGWPQAAAGKRLAGTTRSADCKCLEEYNTGN